MPAYTTVSKELAAEYPSLKDKIGQTITSGELAAAKADSKGEKSSANKVLPAPKKVVAAPKKAAASKPKASKGGKK